jgi:hypothetical protein
VGCLKGEGPDHDFGSSPIVRTLAGGRQAQIATGEKLWHAPAPKPACLGQPVGSVAQPASGSMNSAGPTVGGAPGNVLLAYSVDGR